jgi:plasmid stabilization system protein ParE
VIWAPEAQDAHDAYIDWLVEYDERRAQRAHGEIQDWVALLASRPFIGNGSRWPGFRVHGDSDMHKLIIYEVFDDHIEIIAFRDMRQDNSKLRLRPKSK